MKVGQTLAHGIEKGEEVTEKTQHMAGTARSKAEETADTAKTKANESSEMAKQKANQVRTPFWSGLNTMRRLYLRRLPFF